ncbi:non-ribosomal peptide synthetase [Bacillus thuringiensis]|uniref:non-ribosomal peptide synthetase n=1 Tax=Bacillus thuringiensis TaxID=1428 RepID=UPI000BFA5E1A|nr:non-ribosomal peptide synthetase [Bacillus thuringiensis]PEY73226.1 non-ribosomal peptide synthetase [Bacillus thuringiensis]
MNNSFKDDKEEAGVEIFAIHASSAQRSMWFFDQLTPGEGAYNILSVFEFSGKLNALALENSLEELIERHEALRTTFEMIEGELMQLIHPKALPSFFYESIRNHDKRENSNYVREIIQAETERVFDLERGPLLITRLIEVAEEKYVFIVNIHHIVTDLWSLEIFMKELISLYHSYTSGDSMLLPPLSIQYADYAIWQQQWLEGEECEKQIKYWRKQLHGELPVLNLPTDRPRPAIQTYRGDVVRFQLKSDIVEALQEMSQRNGSTLYMTLLSAYAVWLNHYSDQEDILIGSPIANRNLSEIEGVIGCFVNTLVMRIKMSRELSFGKLMESVNQIALEAYSHQEVPFEKLVTELQPKRESSYSPIFQTMFVLQNTNQNELKIPNLSIKRVNTDSVTSKFDLTLYLEEQSDGLAGAIEYNVNLFDRLTIERMAQHFSLLLEAVTRDENIPINQYSILPPEEKKLVLETWNETEAEYSLDYSLVYWLEEQQKKTPNAEAIIFEGKILTYQELHERANQLANTLIKRGIGPDCVVGVCMERSIELVVALLGVMKSGGAYLPLDPQFPSDRLEFMVNDAQAKVILTNTASKEDLQGIHAEIICLDSSREKLEQESKETPNVMIAPENLAYIIFTSGSTGRPKGTLNTHRGLCNHLLWKQQTYNLSVKDRVLQKTPFNFDVSVWEFFWPLITGASLVIAKPGGHKDPAYLLQLIEETQVTTIHFVPSMLDVFLINCGKGSCLSLNKVFCSGEVLPYQLQQRFFSQMNAKLYNLYGPTETAIEVSHWSCKPDQESKIVPIGYPISNTQFYILNQEMQAVPIGVAGELHIGGANVARGYLNREELTYKKFVPNPYRKGEILYKTGDLVRWLPNGTIEYIQRMDNQVKIRGFRIELGEIDFVLEQHPDVQRAVTIAHDFQGDKRLVAYIVMTSKGTTTWKELCVYLKNQLPDYMIPSKFLEIEKLPLLSNGKINRRALPVPEFGVERSVELISPRSEIEQELVMIWAELLNIDVENISVNENFFDLGGHSLRVTQLRSMIHSRYQVDIPLQELFKQPTVDEISKLIEIANSSGTKSKLTPIVPISRTQPLLLSFAQQRMWFLDKLEGDSSAYNIFLKVEIRGKLVRRALEWSVQEVVRRHEALRTTFTVVEEQPTQVISANSTIKLNYIDLRSLSFGDREKKIESFANQEMLYKFNLHEGPLLRIQLLHVEDEHYILQLNIHHIIGDAWSLECFIKEVAHLYEGYLNNCISSLEELEVQYVDYASWQRDFLKGEVLETQLNYWREKLQEPLPILQMPTDKKRPINQTFVGATRHFDVPCSLVEGIRTLGKSEDATLFMTMLSVFQLFLHRYTGQDDIVVGSPIANRERQEIQRLFGFFANTLALRLKLSDSQDFKSILREVRRMTLGAYTHQDVPFEKLVEALQPERNRAYSPIFQTMFVLQHEPLIAELPNLSMKVVPVESVTSKFDLTLFMWEGNGKLKAAFEYNTDLFSSETVDRWIEHFICLLESVLKNPDKPVSTLSLMREEEQVRLLEKWNETQQTDILKEPIWRMFERQVAKTPNQVAVTFGAERWTYKELDLRANQVARSLRELGVGPNVPVGISIPRSVDMIIVLLAVFKAGGGYLPLDPAYPKERLAFMLKDASVPLLVTTESLAMSTRNVDECNIETVEQLYTRASEFSTEPLHIENMLSDLGYILYTSGSTGRPKGIFMTQGPLVNLLNWQRKQLKAAEKTLQFTTIGFDVAFQEIFSTLCSGGTLVMMSEETRQDLNLVGKIILQEDIERLFLPFVALEHLSRVFNNLGKYPKRLREVITAGEAMQITSSIHTMFQNLKETMLYNHYGPSESHVVTSYQLNQNPEKWEEFPPIGRPINNVKVYILDKNQQPVPIGVIGEIYISGDCLCKEYINLPELTAEKFVVNPFIENGTYMYKTGDLGCYRANGEIEYVGRIDNQFKIRGFRIETGEVESALSKMPGIRDSIVLVNGQGVEKRLEAYIITNNGDISVEQVIQFLRQRIPYFMIPSQFVQLKEWPLTPSGKVDRRALSLSSIPLLQEVDDMVKPRTEVEEYLVVIWKEYLALTEVSVKHNFFDLGGHSLLAMQVIDRVCNDFEIEISVGDLFNTPVLEGFARRIEDIIISEIEKLSEEEVDKHIKMYKD